MKKDGVSDKGGGSGKTGQVIGSIGCDQRRKLLKEVRGLRDIRGQSRDER